MRVWAVSHLPKYLVRLRARQVIAAFLGILVLSVAACVTSGPLRSRAVTPKAGGFATIRMKTIQSQLNQVEGEYVIALGDSHAERLYLPELCGLPVLNAGMSGATAGDVLGLVRALAPRRKARQLVLIVGTNDIWIRRHPEDPGAVQVFSATLGELLDRLDDWADRITLIAIPPVASKQEAAFPRTAAIRFDAAMREVCDARRCDVVNAFDIAGEPAGAALPGIDRDGVHLTNYARHLRAAESRLCSGPTTPAPAHALDGLATSPRG